MFSLETATHRLIGQIFFLPLFFTIPLASIICLNLFPIFSRLRPQKWFSILDYWTCIYFKVALCVCMPRDGKNDEDDDVDCHHTCRGHLEVTHYWIMMTIMTITITMTRDQIWRSLNRRHGKHLFLLHRLSSHRLSRDLPHLMIVR